jgi:hypothetical protein
VLEIVLPVFTATRSGRIRGLAPEQLANLPSNAAFTSRTLDSVLVILSAGAAGQRSDGIPAARRDEWPARRWGRSFGATGDRVHASRFALYQDETPSLRRTRLKKA